MPSADIRVQYRQSVLNSPPEPGVRVDTILLPRYVEELPEPHATCSGSPQTHVSPQNSRRRHGKPTLPQRLRFTRITEIGRADCFTLQHRTAFFGMILYPKRLIEVGPADQAHLRARSAREVHSARGIFPRCTSGGRGVRWPRARAVICAALWPDPDDANCPAAFAKQRRSSFSISPGK